MRAEIGLMFSTSGPYAELGRSARAGAELAVQEIRARDGIELVAHMRDPAGIPARYESMTGDLLERGIRHLVGAITSWSRKDMIPLLERHGGLLWYPCPYEGFECNDQVVYLGASPNQHMVPLVDRMTARGRRRAWLVGSDYVWGWETLRLARERIAAAEGTIAGEAYIPLGETDCAGIVEELARARPSLVVNSLIGPSSVAFMSALAALREADPGLDCQVVSGNMTEAELPDLGAAADGTLSMGAWFEGAGPSDFLSRARASAPHARLSSFFATSYTAVHLVAGAIRRAGTDDARTVFRAAAARRHETVLGPLRIDPVTRHAALTPRLARARGGAFDILEVAPEPVPADPYLTALQAAPTPARRQPELRIVR